jgi:2-succinyl-5-enolpyruvyl-6-hydroxy-3-cyclohexene-1-carboxylate synthase
MPVRDVDAFAPASGRSVRVFSNRGINGIDGTLSSALGVAATSAAHPTVVLSGDLAFLHDLNGLLIGKRHGLRLTVVVVNNDGGGIFSFLPIAKARHFEELFATPHGVDFQHAAALVGATYVQPRSPKELQAALHKHIGPDGISILDVKVDRHASPSQHQAVAEAVQNALKLEGPWA